MSDQLKEYEKLKKQLQQAILKKKQLDKDITQIEEQIFQKETAYLSESNNSNIVRGFESKTGANNVSSNNNNVKKKLVFTDDDRIFSLSSHTFVRHLQKRTDEEEESNDGTPPVSGTKRKRRQS
jgi:chromatin modification-related protein EAF6